MKKFNKITPEGTRDLLFEECTARRKVEKILSEIFITNGYNEVMTPGVEFFDVFYGSCSKISAETMYKLNDNKGRILALRPDSTLPIARLVSTRLKNYEFPLRLFYTQDIFCISPGNSGKRNQIVQSGAELIGAEGFEADMEIIKMSAKTLSACSSDDFRIEIGHIGFFKALSDSLDADDEVKEDIRGLIELKNYAALNDLLAKLPKSPAVEAIKSLPRLFGSQEVFEIANELCVGELKSNEKLMGTLEYLKYIYNKLCNEGLEGKIIIDLGLVNRKDYYTGVIFRGYTDGAGEAVLSGGRYDELFKEFGEPRKAIGFAVNVDSIVDSWIENSNQTNEQKTRVPLRIALTKGRLEEQTVNLLEKMGFDCKNIKEKGRKLIIKLDGGNLEIVLAKAVDVITYIEHGVCDIGVVGKDTILEHGQAFYEVMDLGFGKCKFALATQKGKSFYDGHKVKTIATKYTNVARSFFEAKDMDVEIIKIEGSVELAPLLGLADAIVDIVETGTTLKENGLEVIEDIAPVSARLIVNMASLKLRKEEIEKLLKGFSEAINQDL
jgi:ATP phosphoribosyltransferase regulatory subunit/ATP phosphoribosyltransferase